MISQERIKRLWEWCGFQYRDEYPDGRGNWGRITFPDGHEISELKFHLCPYPPIDLNSLFKWAVPKTETSFEVWQDGDGFWHWRPYSLGIDALGWDADPATALFLAIERLIEEGQ